MDFHERANSLIKNTLLSIEKWDSLIYSTKRLSLINNSELSNISALKNIKLPETAITLYYIFHEEECDNDGFVKEGFLGTLVDVANSLSVHIHHKSLIPIHVSVYIDTYFVQKIKKDQ